jgi:hypothetical protein
MIRREWAYLSETTLSQIVTIIGVGNASDTHTSDLRDSTASRGFAVRLLLHATGLIGPP